MGSFCISCCVSGQIIADDDLCLAIPIIQNHSFVPAEMLHKGERVAHYGIANSVCHPGAYWKPMVGVIAGRYVDYGRIEPDDTPMNRVVMAEFFVFMMGHSMVVLEGKNRSHDIAVNLLEFAATHAPDFLAKVQALRQFSRLNAADLAFTEMLAIWHYLWEATHEHRLFAMSHGVVRPVQFAAIHQLASDQLRAIANSLRGWDGQTYELAGYLAHELTRIKAKVDATAPTERASTKKFLLYSTLRERLALNLSDSASSVLLPFMDIHSDLINQHLEGIISFDAFVAAMAPTMTGIYLLKGMDALDLKFGPITYAGQDYDNAQGQAYAKFVTKVSRDVTKARKRRG